MLRYTLPEVPYDYAALEPHLPGHLMELHHDRHHRGYVDNANKTLEALAQARKARSLDSIGALEEKLAFNVSGHVLHCLFWQNLAPDGGGQPSGRLKTAIDRDFGDFQTFQLQMNQAAATIMGSGWCALVWDPLLRRLLTTQIHDHQSEVTQASAPLMVMDAWEHAYYLKYETDKARYLKALWELWNWDDIAARLDRAMTLDLGIANAAGEAQPPQVPVHH
jgi:Fe-Mn family superoxide dismutase